MKIVHLVFLSYLALTNFSFAGDQKCTCTGECAVQCETGQPHDCQCKECDCAKGGHCGH